MREKIINLREILKKAKIDVLHVLTKQNLILASQIISSKWEGISFHLSGEMKRREEKFFFGREGFVGKQMKNFETKNAGTICFKLTIAKKKWCILFTYHPPNTDKEEFFNEISVSLNKILGKYDNIILAGDLNIDELRPCSDSSKSYLSDMKDIFSVTNLMKVELSHSRKKKLFASMKAL